MMNHTVDQVNATTNFELETQEMTVPTNQVANQAEGVIADQVVACALPFTAMAKVLKTFRPTSVMHNYILKK